MGEEPHEQRDAQELPPGWVDVAGYRGPDRRIRRRSRRFLERYERRHDQQHSRLASPIRVLLGVFLILLGVAIGWLPGPGFVILALPGAFLVASEVRRAATMLDRAENETIPRLQLTWARFRGRAPAAWIERDPDLWRHWEHTRRTNGNGPVEPHTELAEPLPDDASEARPDRTCSCGGSAGSDR